MYKCRGRNRVGVALLPGGKTGYKPSVQVGLIWMTAEEEVDNRKKRIEAAVASLSGQDPWSLWVCGCVGGCG